jgi:hypothetical protein
VTDAKQLAAAMRHAVDVKLPEDEPNEVRDWVYEACAEVALATLESRPDEFDQFCVDVRAEVARASAKWPERDLYHRLAALAGEVGEVAQGLTKRLPIEALRAEAVQVAACAWRFVRVLVDRGGWRPAEPRE